ncbi:MAG: tol-pal system YbgF family protein [Candidatus Zixiibacteriota bacterium]
MSPRRITKKEMKEDKLVTTAFRLSEWVQGRLNQLLMVAGGVVLVAIMVFFVFSSRARRNQKAAELFGKATLEFQTGDANQAITDLRTVMDKYGGTKSAGQATFYLGAAYFYAKDYAKAKATFQRFIEKYAEDPLLLASAQAGIAECDMEIGEFRSAGDNFVKAVSFKPDGLLAPQYLFSAGRAYLKADQKEKAKEVFKRLIDQYPDSKEAYKAKEQLAENLLL